MEWLAATELHRDSVAAIFKTAATRAGINATNIAGHSVRVGMATQAALNGSSERAIARTTRFAELHPAGRDAPRERFGESRPLVRFPGIKSREMTSYQRQVASHRAISGSWAASIRHTRDTRAHRHVKVFQMDTLRGD